MGSITHLRLVILLLTATIQGGGWELLIAGSLYSWRQCSPALTFSCVFLVTSWFSSPRLFVYVGSRRCCSERVWCGVTVTERVCGRSGAWCPSLHLPVDPWSPWPSPHLQIVHLVLLIKPSLDFISESVESALTLLPVTHTEALGAGLSVLSKHIWITCRLEKLGTNTDRPFSRLPTPSLSLCNAGETKIQDKKKSS